MRTITALSAIAVLVASATNAMAVTALPASSCSTFNTANGTTSLPGTYVGTLGTSSGDVCKIGQLGAGDQARVDAAQRVADYEFFFGGGGLDLIERLGVNASGNSVTVNLYQLQTQASTTGTIVSSVTIPEDPARTPFYTVYNGALDAGYYSIGSTLNQKITPTLTAIDTDPNIEIAVVPEPTTLALLLAPVMLASVWRRRQS